MHTRIREDYQLEKYIHIQRLCNGKKAKTPGAYAFSGECEIILEISRRLGICSVDMPVYDDTKGSETVYTFDYVDTNEKGCDLYSVKLPIKDMCAPLEDGLFYYYFRLFSGNECLYVANVNNVDFYVTRDMYAVNKFRLLVYEDGLKTPDWAKKAVMYHIFVDRFHKTKDKLPVRDDCVVNEDWENGMPQFGLYPGAHLENNEFFGGSLYGVIEKLDYLESLGVNCIYLSPIFKAYSNHKYDTGDYMRIDEMFGGEKAFAKLIKEAGKRNIHIILDGVFNHTGNDSIYFNQYGKYDSLGAYQDEKSEYHDWYFFKNYPDEYECWWDIKILPKLNNRNPDTVEHFLGKNGVVRKYISEGTSGWRLDVADELPHDFLTRLCKEAKEVNPDALIIGEVWENAADKIAYDKRRKYFSGYQLDSVMNYPIKNAIIDYMKTGNSTDFYNGVTEIYSSYPPQNASVLMNVLGTHDTERILTVLGCRSSDLCISNPQKSKFALTPEQREKALKLLKVASVLQYTLPGMPSVFYGDEAGFEGMGDPFCRKPYPWGSEDKDLVEHYKAIGNLKRNCKALHGADLEFVSHENGVCVYTRGTGKDTVTVCVNMTDSPVFIDFAENKRVLVGEISKDNEILPYSAVVAK